MYVQISTTSPIITHDSAAKRSETSRSRKSYRSVSSFQFDIVEVDVVADSAFSYHIDITGLQKISACQSNIKTTSASTNNDHQRLHSME